MQGKKKKLTAPVIFENKQLVLRCLAKRKKTPTESTEPNIKIARNTKSSEFKIGKPTLGFDWFTRFYANSI